LKERTFKLKQFTFEEKKPVIRFMITYGFCLLLSIIFLLIATKSSPLYPFNDWVDVNASFTMGKAMMNGKVLYRDIFDHRGPILYFIYGLAYLISNNSFLGVFIFEAISLSIFSFFSFKLIMLYLDIKFALIALPLMNAAILNLNSFAQGGSPEEFCIPMIAISLYFLFVYFRKIHPKTLPNQLIFVNGIIAGCILWTKFSLLGFWIGWITSLVICTVISHGIIQAMKTVLVFMCGTLIATLPWIVYFGINHSIFEWMNSYIYFNFTSYSEKITLISIIIFPMIGILKQLVENPVFICFLFWGMIEFVTKKKFIDKLFHKLSVLLCFLLLILSVFGGGKKFNYYFLIISPFIIFGFIAVLTKFYEKFEEMKSKKLIYFIIATIIVTFLFTLQFNNNTYMLDMTRDDLVQYKFASIINQIEDATLLNYGTLDSGFYTTTGIIPNIKYFYKPNISYSRFPLILDEQIRYIREKIVDYVVIKIPSSSSDESQKIPYLYENYMLIEKEIQQSDYFLLFERK